MKFYLLVRRGMGEEPVVTENGDQFWYFDSLKSKSEKLEELKRLKDCKELFSNGDTTVMEKRKKGAN